MVGLCIKGVGEHVNTRLWRSKWFLALAAGLAAISFLAVACTDDDDDPQDEPTAPASATTAPGATEPAAGGGEIDYGSLGGQIRIDGSSTVFPISEAVAEEFGSVASGVRANVGFSGTGGGFEKFCRGETEISDASRPIEDDEVQACADNGIADIVELQVAIDALTVVANPGLDFLECLTVQQLHDIFTGVATTWDQVDPSFPTDSIVLFFPGADSGTFDYFVEVLESVDENAAHTGDGTASEDDNVLAQGIEGDPNGLGYFGFAYFQEAGDALKAVSIDGGEGCVAPSLEAALDGSYQPLSRPLFIYTSEELLGQPEVLGFTKFYLDNTNTLAAEVGYVPMPEDLLAEQQAKLEPFLP